MYNNYYRDKVALVTGAESGIGRGLCRALAEAGSVVICSDSDLTKADETVNLAGQGLAMLFLSRLFKGVVRMLMQKLINDYRTKHRINN